MGKCEKVKTRSLKSEGCSTRRRGTAQDRTTYQDRTRVSLAYLGELNYAAW
jgi:hypothetical protein